MALHFRNFKKESIKKFLLFIVLIFFGEIGVFIFVNTQPYYIVSAGFLKVERKDNIDIYINERKDVARVHYAREVSLTGMFNLILPASYNYELFTICSPFENFKDRNIIVSTLKVYVDGHFVKPTYRFKENCIFVKVRYVADLKVGEKSKFILTFDTKEYSVTLGGIKEVLFPGFSKDTKFSDSKKIQYGSLKRTLSYNVFFHIPLKLGEISYMSITPKKLRKDGSNWIFLYDSSKLLGHSVRVLVGNKRFVSFSLSTKFDATYTKESLDKFKKYITNRIRVIVPHSDLTYGQEIFIKESYIVLNEPIDISSLKTSDNRNWEIDDIPVNSRVEGSFRRAKKVYAKTVKDSDGLKEEGNASLQKLVVYPAEYKKDSLNNLILYFDVPATYSGTLHVKGFAVITFNKNKDKKEVKKVIEKLSLDSYFDKTGDKLLLQFTQPVLPYWPVEDVKIQKIASDLKKQAKTVLHLLENDFNFVLGRIKYDEDIKPGSIKRQGALGVLLSGKGVCMEYSDLLITILRAQGVPAVAAYGNTLGTLTDSRFKELGHQWVEIWIPSLGWIPLDPTWSKKNELLYGVDLDHLLHYRAKGPEEPQAIVCKTYDQINVSHLCYDYVMKVKETSPSEVLDKAVPLDEYLERARALNEEKDVMHKVLDRIGRSALGRFLFTLPGFYFMISLIVLIAVNILWVFLRLIFVALKKKFLRERERKIKVYRYV